MSLRAAAASHCLHLPQMPIRYLQLPLPCSHCSRPGAAPSHYSGAASRRQAFAAAAAGGTAAAATYPAAAAAAPRLRTRRRQSVLVAAAAAAPGGSASESPAPTLDSIDFSPILTVQGFVAPNVPDGTQVSSQARVHTHLPTRRRQTCGRPPSGGVVFPTAHASRPGCNTASAPHRTAPAPYRIVPHRRPACLRCTTRPRRCSTSASPARSATRCAPCSAAAPRRRTFTSERGGMVWGAECQRWCDCLVTRPRPPLHRPPSPIIASPPPQGAAPARDGPAAHGGRAGRLVRRQLWAAAGQQA